MKRILIILVLSSIAVFAQDNYKGKISLVFNGESISVPVNSVTLRKEDKILLSVKGEINKDNIQQMIRFDLTFNKLAPDNDTEHESVDAYGTKIHIISNNGQTDSGKEFYLDLAPKGRGRYSAYSQGERVTWDIKSLHLILSVDDIEYKNYQLKINGSFKGDFKSSLKKSSDKNIVEIKNCKFEIII